MKIKCPRKPVEKDPSPVTSCHPLPVPVRGEDTKTNSAPKDEYLMCPSFDDEPWKSRAVALRPKSLDAYTVNLTDTAELPPPLPESHPYVRLILEYLDSLPDECWIDEENDVD